ncbi:hypothetical protein [Arthrobacter sp. SRS-W-1-2016]|uniref:hypothetical protein n=1 Tax=Arthrobacter sp. SRS-W-1-2016 TaxID=1930254 RepID=UPI0015C527BD|nr:hypothetical protein [Arthrobacter sp. SRS-W-1-2016]
MSLPVSLTKADRVELERIKMLADLGVVPPKGSFGVQIPGDIEILVSTVQASAGGS